MYTFFFVVNVIQKNQGEREREVGKTVIEFERKELRRPPAVQQVNAGCHRMLF